jgi:hypothetical protein
MQKHIYCAHNQIPKHHYYCIIFTLLHYTSYYIFTYIHTLCSTITWWSWGHKTRKLFCRLLEEERQELLRLFPESSIFNLEFPHGKKILLIQHSAVGVPICHLCLVSSRLFSSAIAENQRYAFTTASFI